MRWIDGDGYDALVQRRSAISGPCPALAVAVWRGLWARGQELQVAGAEEVVEAVLERLGHFEANAMGSEKNSAAVFEDEGELQLAVAGRGTDDLADFFEVREYPTAKFESTKITAAKDGQATVTGKLTLHGVTKEISIVLVTSIRLTIQK